MDIKERISRILGRKADVMVLSRQIDDLKPTLTRRGYNVRALAEQFNVNPVEIKAFLAGTLHADRIRELIRLHARDLRHILTVRGRGLPVFAAGPSAICS
jgi:hypothetical protein